MIWAVTPVRICLPSHQKRLLAKGTYLFCGLTVCTRNWLKIAHEVLLYLNHSLANLFLYHRCGVRCILLKKKPGSKHLFYLHVITSPNDNSASFHRCPDAGWRCDRCCGGPESESVPTTHRHLQCILGPWWWWQDSRRTRNTGEKGFLWWNYKGMRCQGGWEFCMKWRLAPVSRNVACFVKSGGIFV